jgi:zinc-ribbon domain
MSKEPLWARQPPHGSNPSDPAGSDGTETNTSGVSNCPSCGHKLPEYTKFCSNCGARLSGARRGEETVAEAWNRAHPADPMDDPPTATTSATPGPGDDRAETTRQPKTALLIGLGAVAVVALLLGAGLYAGGVFSSKSRSNGEGCCVRSTSLRRHRVRDGGPDRGCCIAG